MSGTACRGGFPLCGRRTRPVPLWSGGNCVQGSGSHPSRRRLCSRRLPLAGIVFLEQIEEDEFRCELIRPAPSFFPALLLSLGSCPDCCAWAAYCPRPACFSPSRRPRPPSETPVRSSLLPWRRLAPAAGHCSSVLPRGKRRLLLLLLVAPDSHAVGPPRTGQTPQTVPAWEFILRPLVATRLPLAPSTKHPDQTISFAVS